MANKATTGATTGRPGLSPTAIRRLRKVSLWAGTIAAINEAGLRNVLASSMLTVAAPVTATAFVYEVSAMRQAELARLAADHMAFMASTDKPPERSPEKTPRYDPPPGAEGSAMLKKLDNMLDNRSAMLDTFGDDPRTVAPVYGRMIRQMLKEDDDTFSSLSDARAGQPGDVAIKLSERETKLRVVHEKLTRLAGA